KTVTEHQEAKNHQAALGYLFRQLNEGTRNLTEDDIKKLHSILMNGIWPNAGQYRDHPVRIVGSNVVTANPAKVPVLMGSLVRELNKKPKNTLAHLAKTHAQFEQIHPFSDGNGRIGRLLMAFVALRDKLPPVLIKRDKRQVYYTYLQRAQTEDQYTFLESFVGDGILESYKLLQ
ncbi:MAG: Fic family protein, partial [Ferruginibacter sp.]